MRVFCVRPSSLTHLTPVVCPAPDQAATAQRGRRDRCPVYLVAHLIDHNLEDINDFDAITTHAARMDLQPLAGPGRLQAARGRR